MQSSIKTETQLEAFYNDLKGNYEGYIQMSDSRIEHIFQDASPLPEWHSLHNGVNYILELALYEPESKNSILIRQANENWVVLEKILTDQEIKDADNFYTIKDNVKAKIAQIWEEQEDEFCLGLKTLIPQTLLFAGFAKGGAR